MPVRIGILCIPEYDEEAAAAVHRLLSGTVPGALVLQERRTHGQRHLIADVLRRWSDEEELDLILTIGGTLPAPGPSARELVPEATLDVAERLLPGLAEAMRARGQEFSPLALLDRGVAVIRGRTAILNLPAGAGPAGRFLAAVVEVLPAVLAHMQDDPAAPVPADEIEGMQEESQALRVPAETRQTKGLDPAEFADFLRRTRGGEER
jgi:molybdopterin biosynthesis enzyme MoaB